MVVSVGHPDERGDPKALPAERDTRGGHFRRKAQAPELRVEGIPHFDLVDVIDQYVPYYRPADGSVSLQLIHDPEPEPILGPVFQVPREIVLRLACITNPAQLGHDLGIAEHPPYLGEVIGGEALRS
jgi:hypothetical protein